MEDGDYGAKLVKDGGVFLQFGYAGQGRTPKVDATFELENGHVMQWTGWLTPAASERTLESLECLGFVGDLDTFNNQTPHGRCSVTVRTDEYKGRTSQKIAFVNSPTRRMKGEDRMSAADLKRLAASLKRKGNGFDIPLAPIPSQGALPTDDDIPF